MKSTISFSRIAARLLFIMILFFALTAPKLYSTDPGPLLLKIRSISVNTWIVLLAVILFAMWLYSRIIRISLTVNMEDAAQIILIDEAVNIQNGGNALASAPFYPVLKWFNLLGWIEVKEFEKECVVIDGTTTIRKTRLFFTPARILGKPISARRVLINPPPLVNITETALTRDRYNLKLVVTVKFSISDPCYVASLSAPLSELIDVIKGKLVEEIHSNELLDIIRDEGDLCRNIARQLRDTPTIHNHYKIEVVKADPTGDTGIIEIIRKKREEIEKTNLIVREGQNRQISAQYDLEIERAKAYLKEELIRLEFERTKEALTLTKEHEIQQEVIRAIAQITAGGVNPASVMSQLRTLIEKNKSEVIHALPEAKKMSLIEYESKALDAIKDNVGFDFYKIETNPDSFDKPSNVFVVFAEYTIKLVCSSQYPVISPSVYIKVCCNEPREITISWLAGSNLAYAIMSTVLQARTLK